MQGTYEGSDLDIDLLLDRGVCATGRVIDERGSPLSGRWVSLVRSDAASPSEMIRTDEQGRFELGSDAPGLYQAVVGRPGAQVRTAPLQLSEGPPAVFPDITLKRRMPLLSGHVVAADGSPLPGLDVVATRAGEDGRSDARTALVSRTDERGRFSFSPRARVSHELRIRALGDRSPIHWALPGESDVVLRVRHAATIVQVVDTQGDPLPGAVLTIHGWAREALHILDGVREGNLELATVRPWASYWSRSTLASPDASQVLFPDPGIRYVFTAFVRRMTLAEHSQVFEPSQVVTRLKLHVHRPQRSGAVVVIPSATGEPKRKESRLRLCSPLGTPLGDYDVPTVGHPLALPVGTYVFWLVPGRDFLRDARGRLEPHFLLAGSKRGAVVAGQTTPVPLSHPVGGRVRVLLRGPGGEEVPDAETKSLEVWVAEEGQTKYRLVGMWMASEAPYGGRSSRWQVGAADTIARVLTPGAARVRVIDAGVEVAETMVTVEAGTTVDLMVRLR